MRRLVLSLFIIFIPPMLYPGYQILPKYQRLIRQEARRVVVVEIFNTQTLTVRDETDKLFQISLLGIDTDYIQTQPNLEQNALTLMKKLVLNKTIYLFNNKNKTEAKENPKVYVYYPSNIKYLLNATLLEAGLARCSTNNSHWLKDEFLKLEKIAKRRRMGLWKSYSKRSKSPLIKAVKLKQAPKKFSDPEALARLTAAIYHANNDPDKLKAIYKQYDIVGPQDWEDYFVAVTYFNDNKIYQTKLDELTNNKDKK